MSQQVRRVTRLVQRTQHQVGKNPLFRLSRNLFASGADNAADECRLLPPRAWSPLIGRMRPAASRRRALPAALFRAARRCFAQLNLPRQSNSRKPARALRIRELSSGPVFHGRDEGSAMPRLSRYCATASFAASMNSSMSRWAIFRSLRTMLNIRPCSSNSITGSGKSKSIEPRSWRRLIQDQREFLHPAESSATAFVALAHLGDRLRALCSRWCRSFARRSESLRAQFGQLSSSRSHPFASATLITSRSTLRIQRADAVRQFLRQHRNRAIRKIDRRAAEARLAIERRSAPDVMRDVGNVHLQFVVARSAVATRERHRQNRAPSRHRSSRSAIRENHAGPADRPRLTCCGFASRFGDTSVGKMCGR